MNTSFDIATFYYYVSKLNSEGKVDIKKRKFADLEIDNPQSTYIFPDEQFFEIETERTSIVVITDSTPFTEAFQEGNTNEIALEGKHKGMVFEKACHLKVISAKQ